MPGRGYSANGAYRYRFNGKENDNEAKGEGGQIGFESRIYNPRTGRFLSVDPAFKDYESFSSYCFAANNPIRFIDVYGQGPGDPIVTNAGSFTTSRRLSSYTANELIAELERRTPDPFKISPQKKGRNIAKALRSAVSAVALVFTPVPNNRRCCTSDVCGQGINSCDWGRLQRIIIGLDHLEIYTDDASELPDWYVQNVKTRLLQGKGSVRDWMYKEELVKRGILARRFGEEQEFGKTADGGVLGRKLERVVNVRPKGRHEAHHIVAGKHKLGQEAREILLRDGIEINDADNGIFFLEYCQHKKLYTPGYFKKVTDGLKSSAPGKVREALRKIGNELLSGTF